MKFKISVFILFCILFICSSWGFLMHRTISQIAVYSLPDSLQKFYFKNMRDLVKKSVDPDLRQKDDSTERTKHFINLDGAVFKNNALPDDWNKAVKKFGVKKLNREGTLPWQIIKTKTLLTEAFFKKDKEAIILYSADLSHYISDAYVPLHATKNYDGKLTNQEGIHGLWETECPQMFIDKYNLKQSKPAIYIPQINKVIWTALRESNKLSKTVLTEEKNASVGMENSVKYKYQLKNGEEERKYSAIFIEKYNTQMAKQINDRMLLSAEMVANLWYTAWVDAKKPDLTILSAFNNIDSENLQREMDAWQNHQLIRKKLLRAKNGNN